MMQCKVCEWKSTIETTKSVFICDLFLFCQIEILKKKQTQVPKASNPDDQNFHTNGQNWIFLTFETTLKSHKTVWVLGDFLFEYVFVIEKKHVTILVVWIYFVGTGISFPLGSIHIWRQIFR